ncbi:HET-domain-containing protein [Macroventuria anomochaeta]|uniref:HET-domain-containing protein n=1 Tax=Macroventuria anomochaeta TaxID=301207 RepID=A0ACB6S0Z1_9PLEO|nr:HET-domain-containing protein [Macroventuria anomochaeta]KAF2627821.1 HET-domain-containing protein [Macroventuria anomochaeta]
MRLLEIQHDGKITLTEDLMSADNVPAYAILSHTWLPGQEVTFDEFTRDVRCGKAGFDKIRFCAQQAQQDGLRYFWVDTCCINKADPVELQHAINSMFRWYQQASRCYVLLTDVFSAEPATDRAPGIPAWEGQFRQSRWFTRGWTLQELLAPRRVSFYSGDRTYLGDRYDLKQVLHEITNIPCPALAGAPLDSFSVEERLSWSNKRQTTREEDKVYSLLGIFGVFTFLNYGEGETNAFKRLRKAIAEDSQESFQLQASAGSLGGRITTNTPAAHKPSYYIPFPKNRYFVGRREELEMLSQTLLEGTGCQKMSIVGLGGTGKTQLALRFAYTVKETMSAVSIFWMPALSMESFEQACVAVATALHISQAETGEYDAKELVKEYLSADRAGPWLLVLDNADDHNILFGTEYGAGIIDYLPESEKGMTVFTTRVQELAVSLTRGDVLELGSMNTPEATDFLEKSLVKKSLAEDRKEVEELLDELACLPLAIAQAAAYLNMNRTTITKYLRLLRHTEQDTISLMSKEFRDQTRYKGSANAVASTWVVSFSQLREHDTVAADLLAFMSCIEWKAIPQSLLPKVQSQERIEEAIGTLCGYSFVSRREGNNTGEVDGGEEWYDLHRLVHLATRVWVDKHGSAADVAQQAMAHVVEVFPTDDFANQAVWRGYMPHALRLLDMKTSVDVHSRAKLTFWVGRCLRFDGRVPEAVRWLEECYRCKEGLDEDDSDRLLSEHELGFSYWANGQIKDAVRLLEHVVKVKDDTLAETDSGRLASQHQLGVSYWANGQIKDAVRLLEHVVKVRDATLAETHPDRLASQHALGVSYWANGHIEDAVRLLEHVVKVRGATLAETHPDRHASERWLSYMTSNQN